MLHKNNRHFFRRETEVGVAVPLSSPQSPPPSCSLVVLFGKSLAHSRQELRRAQGAALGLLPLHMHPQLFCRFLSEGMLSG